MGDRVDPPRLLAIVGPTASGKSALAVEVAEHLAGEIVVCDSMQVYRRLDIGVAKPTPEERASIPHHLLDVAEPTERFTASRYAALAERAIDAIRGRGRLPIVCGGTGLYLRALVHGLLAAPEVDPRLREELLDRAAREGSAALHGQLASLDPASAARIAPGDRQRVTRALEICLGTGRRYSELVLGHGFRERRYTLVGFALDWPRAELYARIERRAERMYRDGIVDEASALLASGLGERAHTLRAVGYRDAVRAAAGEVTAAEALRRTQRDTRRYAKRQLTWFRAMPEVRWVAPQNALDEVIKGWNAR